MTAIDAFGLSERSINGPVHVTVFAFCAWLMFEAIAMKPSIKPIVITLCIEVPLAILRVSIAALRTTLSGR
jgi:hypothetical protein